MIYSEKMSPINRFLSLAVRGGRSTDETSEFIRLFSLLGCEAVHVAASNNKIIPLVAQALIETCPMKEVDPIWFEILRLNKKRVLKLELEWSEIALELDNLGCRHALVENAGVMYGSKMPLSAFSAGDFDILVAQNCWDKVVEVFHSKGFQAGDRRNRPTSRIEFYRKNLDGELQWLNVGHRSFDRMWLPLTYNERSSLWLKRAVRSSTNKNVFVLAVEDALAFVSMHTSLHSYIRSPGIRLHVDVDRLVRDNSIDWDIYLKEIQVMGIQKRAFISLSMAAGLLGTPIPIEVLSILSPVNTQWCYIERLLSREGAFYSGKSKLSKGKTIILDYYIYEHSKCSWLRNIFFPPASWMREHFSVANENLLQLYWKRFLALVLEWRPV